MWPSRPVKAVLFHTMLLSRKDTGRRPRSSWIELCLKSKCESTEYMEPSLLKTELGFLQTSWVVHPLQAFIAPKCYNLCVHCLSSRHTHGGSPLIMERDRWQRPRGSFPQQETKKTKPLKSSFGSTDTRTRSDRKSRVRTQRR